MRQSPFLRFKPFILFAISLLCISVSHAQNSGKIDLSKDTISKAKVITDRGTFLNNLRGHGNKATERINLPVDKLKEIMDACTANGISNISVMIITVGQSTVAHFKQFNPGASDAEIKGSQMLVFKVPRSAFAGAKGAKINLPNHPIMLSLLGAGLALLDPAYTGLPGTGDLYFGFGNICPPPASCD